MVHVWVRWRWFLQVLIQYSSGGDISHNYLFHLLYTRDIPDTSEMFMDLWSLSKSSKHPLENIFGEPDFGRLEVLVLQTNWTPPKTNRSTTWKSPWIENFHGFGFNMLIVQVYATTKSKGWAPVTYYKWSYKPYQWPYKQLGYKACSAYIWSCNPTF